MSKPEVETGLALHGPLLERFAQVDMYLHIHIYTYIHTNMFVYLIYMYIYICKYVRRVVGGGGVGMDGVGCHALCVGASARPSRDVTHPQQSITTQRN